VVLLLFPFFFRDTSAQLRVSGVCLKSSPEYCVFVRVLCLDHVVHGQNMRTMDILHSRRRVVQSKGVKMVIEDEDPFSNNAFTGTYLSSRFLWFVELSR
jgi:hypothetical protein